MPYLLSYAFLDLELVLRSKRIWVVGGSSGIGLELVKLWLEQEHNLVVSSRNATQNEALKELRHFYPDQLVCVDLDLHDTTQDFNQLVSQVWSCFDGLDLWFYNAGAYTKMKAEQWSLEAFSSMNQVNYLGAVALMQSLYPHFKKQGFGRWVFNLSLSAYFGLPYGGAYSAPKAALLNLCESLQPELMHHHIHLQVINHGFVNTRLTKQNDFTMPQLMEGKDAANRIANALEGKYKFEIRFPFGLSLMLRLLRFLPYRLSLALTKKAL